MMEFLTNLALGSLFDKFFLIQIFLSKKISKRELVVRNGGEMLLCGRNNNESGDSTLALAELSRRPLVVFVVVTSSCV